MKTEKENFLLHTHNSRRVFIPNKGWEKPKYEQELKASSKNMWKWDTHLHFIFHSLKHFTRNSNYMLIISIFEQKNLRNFNFRNSEQVFFLVPKTVTIVKWSIKMLCAVYFFLFSPLNPTVRTAIWALQWKIIISTLPSSHFL